MSGYGGRRVRELRRLVAEHAAPVCWLCAGLIGGGRPLDVDDQAWHVDHALPRSLGGGDELANLRPAHAACNTSRGNRAPPPARPEHRWPL